MQSMEELFYALLQDVYFVEKQLLETLPKLARKSTNEKLQEALTIHRDETEGQAERLEKVFKAIGKKPRGKTCEQSWGSSRKARKSWMRSTTRHYATPVSWPPPKCRAL